MIKNYRISICTGLALAFLAIAAYLMANVELPRWSNVLSSFNVLLFAVPSFWALKMWLGWSDGGKLVGILGAYALVVEAFALFTGFPYGHFNYSELLGYKLFGVVPWTVAFAWTPLMLCAYTAARSLFVSRLRRIICSSLLLLAFDMVLDPGAVKLGFWQYPGGGVYYGVPITNFFGWIVSSVIGSAITEGGDQLFPAAAASTGADRLERVLYRIFLDRPGSGQRPWNSSGDRRRVSDRNVPVVQAFVLRV